MKLFDWRTNHVLMDGVEITGFATGDDVLGISRRSDSATDEVGVDGQMYVSLNGDKSISVKLKLMAASPSNAILSKKCAAQDSLLTFVPTVFLWQDAYRHDMGEGTPGYIKKHADIQRGGKMVAQEWELIFGRGDLLLGAPTFAGLLTAAAEAAAEGAI